MTQQLCVNSLGDSLTTRLDSKPNYLEISKRIIQLSDRYLSQKRLGDRLNELPQQFLQPQPRPWKRIDWHSLAPDLLIGIELPVFLGVLKGCIDTEAPIRGYAQISRLYLEKLHPQLARFVGGTVNDKGELIELGLWEKEERRHSPALMKIYEHT